MPRIDRFCAPVQSNALASANPGVFALFPPDACDDCYVRLNADSLHDLMGPVNQIGTLVELVLKKYRGTLDQEGETLFGFVQSSASRLQNLIAGLRMYVRVAGSPSPGRLCDANQLLAGAEDVDPARDRTKQRGGDSRSPSGIVLRPKPDRLRVCEPDGKLDQVPQRAAARDPRLRSRAGQCVGILCAGQRHWNRPKACGIASSDCSSAPKTMRILERVWDWPSRGRSWSSMAAGFGSSRSLVWEPRSTSACGRSTEPTVLRPSTCCP